MMTAESQLPGKPLELDGRSFEPCLGWAASLSRARPTLSSGNFPGLAWAPTISGGGPHDCFQVADHSDRITPFTFAVLTGLASQNAVYVQLHYCVTQE